MPERGPGRLLHTPAGSHPLGRLRRAARRGVGGRPSAARTIGGALTIAFLVLAVAGPHLRGADPFAATGVPFAPPSAAHPFGTDDLGRDVLTGVLHGASTSLGVGVAVAAASLALGILVGAVAGFVGGATDALLMRLTELTLVLPRFFLALTVVALFGASLPNLVAVLAATSWGVVARIVRSGVLAAKVEDHVAAAQALGAGPVRRLVRHVLPLAVGPAFAYAALQVGNAMLVEAGLSFLGFGDPTRVSWGYLLDVASPYLHRAWWTSVFPGAALAAAVVGVNLLADGLRSGTEGNDHLR